MAAAAAPLLVFEFAAITEATAAGAAVAVAVAPVAVVAVGGLALGAALVTLCMPAAVPAALIAAGGGSISASTVVAAPVVAAAGTGAATATAATAATTTTTCLAGAVGVFVSFTTLVGRGSSKTRDRRKSDLTEGHASSNGVTGGGHGDGDGGDGDAKHNSDGNDKHRRRPRLTRTPLIKKDELKKILDKDGRTMHEALKKKLHGDKVGTVWSDKAFRVDAGSIDSKNPAYKSWNLQINDGVRQNSRRTETPHSKISRKDMPPKGTTEDLSGMARTILRRFPNKSTHDKALWDTFCATDPPDYEVWAESLLDLCPDSLP